MNDTEVPRENGGNLELKKKKRHGTKNHSDKQTVKTNQAKDTDIIPLETDTVNTIVCEICEAAFPSKTKLFKHLELHGFEGNGTKQPKIVLLVGWLSDYLQNTDENDLWIGENGDFSSDSRVKFVEDILLSAIYALENGIHDLKDLPASLIIDRPKGFSRGSTNHQRSYFSPNFETSCHAWCDTFCFQSKRWIGNGGDDEWVEKVNSLLPPSVFILKRYVLTNCESSEFNAESSCSQRVYEYLLPLAAIVPNDDCSSQVAPKVRNFKMAPSTAIVDTLYPIDSTEGKNRIAFFRKLKKTLKKYGGERRSMHNFVCGGACPDDPAAFRKVDRVFHKEMVAINSESWAVFSVSGDAFLKGQVRKMLGLSIGIARGWLPEEMFDIALNSETIVDLPALPGWGLYLAECRFACWEAKYVDSRLDPRRRALQDIFHSYDLDLSALDFWKRRVHEHIADISLPYRSGDAVVTEVTDNWVTKLERDCRCMLAKFEAVRTLHSRTEESLRVSSESMFAVTSFASQSDQDDHSLLTASDLTLEDQFNGISQLVCNEDKQRKILQLLKLSLSPIHIADTMSYQTVLLYGEVLRLLREADASGRWPQSSTGRQKVITEGTLKETGGLGGSFSVGCLPLHLAQPKGNTEFPGKNYIDDRIV
jgi:tRNA pseudouridine(38-40) synthase